jgi:outer membrane receptor protein involved in Fe transport
MRGFLLAATGLGLVSSATPAAAETVATVLDKTEASDRTAPESVEPVARATRDSGEIIVTARKRQESILNVPVVEAVITQEQLQKIQIQDVSHIASRMSGVLIGKSPLEIGSQISIRGVGTTSNDPGIDASTALNIDGLQLNQGLAYSVGFFDMAQVEVLKGPQSLFYGKNSPAGVISIRTADPGSELEVIGRAAYEFEAHTWRTEAIISGPATDTLGLRLAAMYQDYGGYFFNNGVAIPETGSTLPNRRYNQSTTLYLRGTAVFRPTSDFSARLKLNYTRDNITDGIPQQNVSCPDGLVSYTGIQFFSTKEDCRQDRYVALNDMNPAAFGGLWNNGVPFTNIRQYFGTLEMNYNIMPKLTLTSITGYYKLTTDTLSNGVNAGAAGSTLAAEKKFRRRDFTQEVRLNSDFSGPLNFSAGGFYQDGHITNNIYVPGNLWLIVPVSFNPFSFLRLRGGPNQEGAPGTGLPPVIQAGTHDVDITSLSFFGQLRYRIIPELEVSAGVRWTHEKRSDTPTTVDALGTVTGTIGKVYYPTPPKIDSDNWSPELTISYTPTEDLTVFGSLKQGYKSGSYNLITPMAAGTIINFGDEKVQGGEIGVKARLADRQIFTNLSFYYYHYDGLQVGAQEPAANGIPVLRTINAGSAKVYGIDFDFTYNPAAIEGLGLFGSVNWNVGKFIDFPNATCTGGQTVAEGCNQVLNPANGRYTAQDLSGTDLPRAPRWMATLGANYEMPVSHDMKLAMGVDGQYSGRYKAALGLREDFYQQEYVKLNANLALHGSDDGWEVALIGNNLTNVLRAGTCSPGNWAGGQILNGVVTGAAAKGASGSDELGCYMTEGREVWIRLTLRPVSLLHGK